MLEKGKKVGEYVLLEKLGTGGFGDVWKAEKRTALDVNYFALKFFRPKQDGMDFDKIRKEIGVWKQLKGLPHIISVIELDRVEDYVYVVSDFADGGSLEKYLQTNGGRAKTEAEAVKITLEILTGLENLHGKGFVHRDLKPDNILIMNGRFCLADFGISREIKTHSKATGTAGTMEYMPPEAFEKTPSVTPQTDIWAVGVILQRLLTGALPYPQDEQPSLIAAILMSDPEEMPETVSPDLRSIVKKALQKNRENRFQTATEMREVLRDFLKSPKKIVSNQDILQSGTLILEDSDKTANLEIEQTQDWREIEAEKEQQRKFEEAQKLKEAEELKRLQEIEIQRQKDEALRLERERRKALSGDEGRKDRTVVEKRVIRIILTGVIITVSLGLIIMLSTKIWKFDSQESTNNSINKSTNIMARNSPTVVQNQPSNSMNITSNTQITNLSSSVNTANSANARSDKTNLNGNSAKTSSNSIETEKIPVKKTYSESQIKSMIVGKWRVSEDEYGGEWEFKWNGTSLYETNAPPYERSYYRGSGEWVVMGSYIDLYSNCQTGQCVESFVPIEIYSKDEWILKSSLREVKLSRIK